MSSEESVASHRSAILDNFGDAAMSSEEKTSGLSQQRLQESKEVSTDLHPLIVVLVAY